MESSLPSAAQVQARLKPLSHTQKRRLSTVSGVSMTTLNDIETGVRSNPGLETVRKFWSFIDSVGLAEEGERTPPQDRVAADG